MAIVLSLYALTFLTPMGKIHWNGRWGLLMNLMKTFCVVSYNLHCTFAKSGLMLCGGSLGWMIERMTSSAGHRIRC